MALETPRPIADARAARLSRRDRWLAAGLVVLLSIVHTLPQLSTPRPGAASGGDDRVDLPCPAGPDLYLYLNLSAIDRPTPETVVNPWYGVEVPAAHVPALRFPGALATFGFLREVTGGGLSATLVVWQLLVALLILASALWLLRVVLPGAGLPYLAVGLCLVLLVDVTAFRSAISAWLRLPALDGFEALRFPYSRSFFPQAGVPLLFLYLGLQIRAFGRGGARWWLALAAVQWISLVTYPHATVLMAMTTGVACVLAAVRRPPAWRWPALAVFALSCAVLDGVYLLATGPPLEGLHLGGGPLVDVDLSRISSIPRGTTLLLLLCGGLVWLRGPASEPAAVLGLTAAAMANALGLFSDLAISPLLQLTPHLGAFAPGVLAVLAVWLLYRYLPGAGTGRRWGAAALALVPLLAHGALAAAGRVRATSSLCRDVFEQAELLRRADPRAGDLVLADARFVDQADWIPLVSPARVLFARNAEFVLGPDTFEEDRRRRALYLHLTGWDSGRLEHLLDDPMSVRPADRGLMRRIADASLPWDADPGIRSSIRDLAARLRAFESGTAAAEAFFRRHRRILVLDRVREPVFAEARARLYFRWTAELRGSTYRLRRADPAPRRQESVRGDNLGGSSGTGVPVSAGRGEAGSWIASFAEARRPFTSRRTARRSPPIGRSSTSRSRIACAEPAARCSTPEGAVRRSRG